MRKLTLLLIVLISMVTSVASAYDAKIDGIYYDFNTSTRKATVTYLVYGTVANSNESAYSGNVVIPNYVTYEGYKYTVTYIDDLAFYGCTGLTSIIIPNSVTSIGRSAFDGCTGLTSIAIPNSVTSIGSSAFYKCTGLTYITIPESVTSIGFSAFRGCTGLTTITIPNSVTSIDISAFQGCTGLTSITIPNSVTSIGSSAFEGCSALDSITINNNSIASEEYKYSSNLSHIFGTQVKHIHFGDAVESIGEYACSGYSSLESVTIGKNVKTIGDYAFNGCSGLEKAEFGSIESLFSIDFSSFYSNPLYYAKHLYINGDEVTDLIIPNGVKSIDNNTLRGFRGLTSITIPESVTSIGSSAFSGCRGLTSITIPESVTSIGSSAFYGCSGLTSITIPESVISIESHVFETCSGLTSITIPESVISIGSYAFSGCSGLTSITIPESVTSIGSSAFSRCSGFSSITIPENITSIGSYAFEKCSNLISITINSNAITSRSLYSIFGSQVKEFILGDSIETIGDNAFSSYSANVVLGDNIKSIGSGAFSYMSNVYVNRNPILLLKIWNSVNGIVNTYLKGTDIALPPSKISVEGTTQMTATVKVMNYYEEFTYTLNDIPIDDEPVTLQSRPGSAANLMLKVSKDSVTYSTSVNYKTKDISPMVARADYTASSLTLKSSYIEGDAPVTAQVLSINGVTVEGDSLYVNGLRPETRYTATYTITVDNQYTYTGRADLYTDVLNFVNVQPKVITEGNVIIASASNLDYEETNVGFQWRRVDWTDDFESNSAVAYTYEGTMEGYIRNMNTNYLWKFRPYYQSSDGSYFYGKWLGIDPTNTSYFEPTVHTYSQITLNGNTALVKGYVMRGSDDVMSQGFKYWEVSNETSETNEVPQNAQSVETTGMVMEVQLTNLAYSTTYRYVAFVMTSEGETFYGDERQFTTGEAPTGIEERKIEDDGFAVGSTIYDLSGRKMSGLQKGINLIRYSNGKIRKVMLK